MSRVKKTAQNRLARLLRGRTEPHGIEITNESILKGVEVDDSGDFTGDADAYKITLQKGDLLYLP